MAQKALHPIFFIMHEFVKNCFFQILWLELPQNLIMGRNGSDGYLNYRRIQTLGARNFI